MKSAVKTLARKTCTISYVAADEVNLVVDLSDGRRLLLPLVWYPRLKAGTPAERNDWRLIGGGEGIHWPALDEDLSLDGFLAGRKSQESPGSFKFWMDAHKKGKKTTLDDYFRSLDKVKLKK